MADENGPKDLLGDPLKPLPDKRGRRKLRFPVQVYEKVELLAASKMDQRDIALVIGVSDKSLRKYFRQELDQGTVQMRAKALVRLDAASEKGNVSATKALLAEIDKQEAAANYRRRDRPASAPRPEAAGKKAAARADADVVVGAGTKFAPRGAVRLATANGEAIAATED